MSLSRTCYFAFFMAIFDALRTTAVWPEEAASTAWSAAAILSGIEAVALAALKQWFVMLGAEPFAVTRRDSLALFMALFAFNYLVLLRRRQWEAFQRSFRALSIGTQRKIKWLARAAVVLVCVGCVYTFHTFWNWAPGR